MYAAVIIVGLFILLELLNYIYLYLFFHIRLINKGLVLGIFIHEFSHLIFCKLTGAKVFEFRVESNSGVVKHSPSKIPLLGDLLISLAPLFVGILILILGMVSLSSLSYQDFWQMSFNSHSLDLIQANLQKILLSFNYYSWNFCFFIFLALNIMATFKPSSQDLKNIFFAVILFFYISQFSFMQMVNIYLIYTFILANILQFLAILILIPFYLIKPLRTDY